LVKLCKENIRLRTDIVKLGNTKTYEEEFISSLKANKVMLSEIKKNRLYTKMEDKVNINNAIKLFSISTVFKISNLSKPSLCFIERWFPIVVDSKDFLALDFVYLAKIIQSSQLFIDTELQVFDAAESWLNHNKERFNYAKVILSRIRLTLLSASVLNNILDKESYFTMNSECVIIIKEVLEHKQLKLDFHSNDFTSNSRYCNQTNFNIILCGGLEISGEDSEIEDVVNYVYSIDGNNIDNIITLPQTTDELPYNMVCTKGEIYVFVSNNNYTKKSIEKYSPFTNTWEKVADMYDNRIEFSACSFMDDIYIIGGRLPNTNIKSCVKFNTKSRTWEECVVLIEGRSRPSSVVFEGKIVVSAGFNHGNLNSVEAYDHVADMWSYMPNMIEGRYDHISVAVKNKLFIFGGYGEDLDGPEIFCEMFDSRCNKFVTVNPLPNSFTFDTRPESVSAIGSKLAVFGGKIDTILFYDVKNEEWSEESFAVTNKLQEYCCAKLPQL